MADQRRGGVRGVLEDHCWLSPDLRRQAHQSMRFIEKLDEDEAYEADIWIDLVLDLVRRDTCEQEGSRLT